MQLDVGPASVKPLFSAPSNRADKPSMDEKEHDAFVAAILARGAAAVKAATKAGKRGSKKPSTSDSILAHYRSLSGAQKTQFAAANAHRLFAAFSNAR